MYCRRRNSRAFSFLLFLNFCIRRIYFHEETGVCTGRGVNYCIRQFFSLNKIQRHRVYWERIYNSSFRIFLLFTYFFSELVLL
jgi:hypothetical protein